jgi:glycosyltransferase involved in cell wall biosynthesis
MGITVVMSSYLGDYPGSRSNPEAKFIRAVQSFINQKHQEKELIIVSDGCEITNGLYKAYYQQNKDITLVRVEKREEAWPGELRESGRSIAKYEWITYLDSDDVILENHLSIINNKISSLYPNEGIIFNMKYGIPLLEEGNERYYKYLGMTREQLQHILKDSKPIKGFGKIAYSKAAGKFGTWQIVHKKDLPVRWMNSEKMGEDRYFIDRLKKISKWQEFTGEYIICHLTINRDLVWEI